MRCAECGLYECCMRTQLGGCPNGEKAEKVVVITAPNTGPVSLPNGSWDKGYKPSGVQDPIRAAALDLVEAVEGYVCPKKGDKYVFRGEVLAKCNELKQLLNETE